MMYTLYYAPGTASLAVHWMLIEIEVPFEAVLVDLGAGGQRTPEYLRLNPQGRVPTLVIDGVPYRESAALLMLLAERHPACGLMPVLDSPQRADWLQMMIYLANTVLPAMRDWFYAGKDGDPSGAAAVTALAKSRLEAAFAMLDERLAAPGGYLVGDAVSTADLLVVMLMRWSRGMPRPATDWSHVKAYVQRMAAMPSFVEVNRREGLSGWPVEG